MEYKIYGSIMPMIELQMGQGECVYAQSGAMQWMDVNIDMHTKMKGGVMQAFKRSFSGGNMFTVDFTALEEGAKVAFGHTYPGNIIVFDIGDMPMVCQQRSFLCATEGVEYDIHIQKKFSTGFFGGEGFIMQKFIGKGVAIVEMDGECVEKELAPGEKIKVETGSVGAFEETVNMEIERVKGFTNMFLGGEGLFLTTLTGPGKVWLQTMPVQSMVGELSKYLPSRKK